LTPGGKGVVPGGEGSGRKGRGERKASANAGGLKVKGKKVRRRGNEIEL